MKIALRHLAMLALVFGASALGSLDRQTPPRQSFPAAVLKTVCDWVPRYTSTQPHG